jgi:hypothetical protein
MSEDLPPETVFFCSLAFVEAGGVPVLAALPAIVGSSVSPDADKVLATVDGDGVAGAASISGVATPLGGFTGDVPTCGTSTTASGALASV